MSFVPKILVCTILVFQIVPYSSLEIGLGLGGGGGTGESLNGGGKVGGGASGKIGGIIAGAAIGGSAGAGASLNGGGKAGGGASGKIGGIVEGAAHGGEHIIGDIRKGTSGLVNHIGKGTEDLIENIGEGAEDLIGDIAEGAGGVIRGIEHGAEDIDGAVEGAVNSLGDVTGSIADLIKHEKWNTEHQDESNHHWNKKHGHGKHGKVHHGHWKKFNGRGINRKNGIGSKDGIRTPINNMLGLSKSVCDVSYFFEDLIAKLGEFHMIVDKEVGHFDRIVVDYVVKNIVHKVVDGVRKYHVLFVSFLIDTHVTWDRFVINFIIEAFRMVKSPMSEMLGCNS